MDALVSVVNRTGNFVLRVMEPLPVDAVMSVFVALAAWVWLENLRGFARRSRATRIARQARKEM